MGDVLLDTDAVSQLGQDQKKLLDSIDSLRSLGVGKLVNLPQIIVVGDQSAGKSSVLEAISRVRFPVKGGLCTRFATELVLRRKPQEELVVKIRASNPDRQSEFNEKRFSKDDLPAIIEEAKKVMGVGDDSNGFSEDILRVEISGPDLEPLTLVDLPGFYHVGTSDQSPEGIATVLRLVEKYMKQKNSIILAVVSAKNEIVQQTVLGEVQKHDPTRERTMGIITKPDTLTPGSLEEEKYLQLAKNQESSHIFKHGWHVLRNRDGQESDERNSGAKRTSNESRDKAEMDFLSSGVWARFSSNNKGVDSLRHKLSKVLTKHIHLSLPGVIVDIENKLEAQKERLQSLGKARSNTLEIRQYLVGIAERLRDLTRAAVTGTYDGKFFADLHMNGLVTGQVSSDERKLRAVIRNLNRAFDAVISVRGSKMRIIDNDDFQFGDDRTVPESLEDWVDRFQVDEPEPISWTELKAGLELQASNNQGTQFPGSPNDRLALELFREQSQRWRDIAEKYLELVTDSAKAFVELILQHVIVADENTRDAIYAEYVVPFFDQRASALEEKLNELLIHYQEGDAVCLEDEFRMRLSRQTRPRLGNQVQRLLLTEHADLLDEETAESLEGNNALAEAIANAPDGQVSEFGLEGVVDMMTTYYEMSLRTFTDNVIILGVENCLISKMASLLTPMMVLEMDEETLSKLGAESPEIRAFQAAAMRSTREASPPPTPDAQTHPSTLKDVPATVRVPTSISPVIADTAGSGASTNNAENEPERAQNASSKDPVESHPPKRKHEPIISDPKLVFADSNPLISNTSNGTIADSGLAVKSGSASDGSSNVTTSKSLTSSLVADNDSAASSSGGPLKTVTAKSEKTSTTGIGSSSNTGASTDGASVCSVSVGNTPITGGLSGASTRNASGDNAPNTGGLFSGTPNSKASTEIGLFSASASKTARSNSPTTGGLFSSTSSSKAVPKSDDKISPAVGIRIERLGASTSNASVSSTPATGGLFAASASNTPSGNAPTTRGLFGGVSSSAPSSASSSNAPTPGGLFGGYGSTTPASNTTANSIPTPTGSGLFGGYKSTTSTSNTTASTVPPPTGGGLFGGYRSTTSTSSVHTPTGGGLFGGNKSNTPTNNTAGSSVLTPPGGGLFGGYRSTPTPGNTASSSVTTPPGSGLFGGSRSTTTANVAPVISLFGRSPRSGSTADEKTIVFGDKGAKGLSGVGSSKSFTASFGTPAKTSDDAITKKPKPFLRMN
ncbi:hypothetical protein G7Z17_g228 [Cylindrodendrum hubeiense]|uniref:Uncharacterized protein n=1 Tax=Cylindrodendrum hubeiense TaxID=595255 RepID=A0A9P5HH92_9HYPO|nr:hypothetical protein G7Z17_g228 [Cylindrodendrum hubeiense]